MRQIAAFLALPIALAPQPAAAQEIPPTSVAEMYCLGRTVGDMSLVQPYVSPDLDYAIEAAWAKNLVAQEKAPDEKPPLGDDIPWQSFPDQAPECLVDYAVPIADPTEVGITYSFPAEPDANWTDTLVIRKVDGAWRIDDVIFTDGTLLTTALTDAFAQ
jgi:hypothetical protein